MSKREIVQPIQTKNPDRVFTVVHYFMHKSRQAGRQDFTNKKAQKMLFYAQAWSLATRNQKLFDDQFEAWAHGAAIPRVYRRYKKFGFQQIDDDYDPLEFETLSESEKVLLDQVWDIYGVFDAEYLEDLNHYEEPWQRARASTPPGLASTAIISEEFMKEYYGKKIKEAQQKASKFK